ncbi:hypothetical protein [Methylomonas albis]|uniref:Glycine zipper 2TM domain-containing protein n=1 Tax=Methylomonas albis TaxID=1854563 RepID=A0ABR9D1Y0_9GAMM|nr:hypothetical protein [Methylomonas albis]MBD9357092.1 hypothetical protein [Methylomonas albis]CAD6880306.1 hypothetical protein [Methylomonas albis]
MLSRTTVIVLGLLVSSAALADHEHWGGHHGHHHHHGYDRPMYREDVIYYQPAPVVEYVPVPRYYAPPPPPVYYGYDQRSPQGLLGGMVGSAMGYQLGNGDPIAAGIGAAAGALLGNGMY